MKNIPPKWLGILGISACALCCTLPLIGSLISLTTVVSMGLWFEKSVWVFLGLRAAAFVVFQGSKLVKSPKQATACSTDRAGACVTDCACASASQKASRDTPSTQQR